MWNEKLDISGRHSGCTKRAVAHIDHVADRPFEHLLTLHVQHRLGHRARCGELRLLLVEIRFDGDGVELGTIGTPHGRTDARGVARTHNDGASAVSEDK